MTSVTTSARQHGEQEQGEVEAGEKDERVVLLRSSGDPARALEDAVASAERRRAPEAGNRHAEGAQRRLKAAVLVRAAEDEDRVGRELAQCILDGLHRIDVRRPRPQRPLRRRASIPLRARAPQLRLEPRRRPLQAIRAC